MTGRRKVYFVSDQTGVTVETLGHSLLEQFDDLEFDTVTVPFVDSVDKAERLASRIDDDAARSGVRPLVFASLVHDPARSALLACNGFVLDFFDAFLGPLERELGRDSSHTLRRQHGVLDSRDYHLRIEATNYPYRGISVRKDADVSVSRFAVRHLRRQLSANRR